MTTWGTLEVLVSDVEKLGPLPVRPIETVMFLGSVVAIAFVFFALWKVSRRDWSWPYAVGLVLLSFLLPFAGPVVAVVRAGWLRLRRRPTTA